jgi:hypothetical protein
MFFRPQITARFFHVSRTALSTDKSALAALRKKTGYTFANCKKALEMHGNDLAKVGEIWTEICEIFLSFGLILG